VADVDTRCVQFEFARRRAPGLSPIAHVRESVNSGRRRGTAGLDGWWLSPTAMCSTQPGGTALGGG
jgi:hypothetical protein